MVVKKMITIEETKEYLKNISRIIDEIKFLTTEQTITGYYTLPNVTGVTNYKKQLQSRINTLFTIKTQLLDAISKIENPDYRVLLEMKYLSNWSVIKISREMNYSPRNLAYIRNKAIAELAKHLDRQTVITTNCNAQEKKYHHK